MPGTVAAPRRTARRAPKMWPLPLWGYGTDLCALWVCTGYGDRLHSVARLDGDRGDWTAGDGLTVCGLERHLRRPGVLERTGMPRCAHCCRILQIPRGTGTPVNDPALRDFFGYGT